MITLFQCPMVWYTHKISCRKYLIYVITVIKSRILVKHFQYLVNFSSFVLYEHGKEKIIFSYNCVAN